MRFFKAVFDFYLISSLHVSFAVWALYKVSHIYYESSENPYLDGLVVTSTIVGYNLIKYGSIFLINKKLISKGIIFITFLSFIVGLKCFFHLDLLTQLVFILSFMLVTLYLTPNPSLNTNMRNVNGVKIFLVSLTWTLVSYVSLIGQMKSVELNQNILMGIQRFVYVFVATIPFEIRDMKIDSSDLGTLPQRFGIFKSKIIAISLLIINMFILYFTVEINFIFKIIELFIYSILFYSIVITSTSKPLNFTRFWIEGIPIIWIFILLAINQIF